MQWNFKNGVPIYQQILSIMETGIANGSYPPGSKIPAVRELALEAGVNPNTMQRALAELEREGLVHSERTSGRYVTEDKQILKKLRKDLGSSVIAEMFASLEALGMSREEIVDAVRVWKKD